VDVIIQKKLARLAEMVNGYDFAKVIECYWRGHQEANEQLKSDAIRWLRGEFTTKTDARNALGVRTIVDDASLYDQLKLLGVFVRLCGFSGLLICLDEMVNLYKLSNSQARNANYEQILRILNDVLQGTNEGLGFILGARRNSCWIPAVGSTATRRCNRVWRKHFRQGWAGRLSAPRRAAFEPEPGRFPRAASQDSARIFLRRASALPLPESGLAAFMAHCHQRIGEAYFRTPRTTITAFINLLAVLQQNTGTEWQSLVGEVTIATDDGAAADAVVEGGSEAAASSGDDEFTKFKL
jgi:hypothetical protein